MAPEGISDVDQTRRDEERLAELGYKQELHRGWSAFTNFAISFTIISVLAGSFTNFAFAWNNGGPIAVSIGWPVLCAFVLMVAFSMAELTSRYPTAGGPYWWAHDLGGKGWSWMTGWFNIVGLIGIVASVAYGAAFFLWATLNLYGLDIFGIDFGDGKSILGETWFLFVLIMLLYTLVNIFADRLLALINNISVGWHLVGVAVIIGLLIFVPDDHQSASFVFGDRFNNNGAFDGSTTALGFWLLVLPVGLHADDVHADGLRRLGAHGGGDPRRREGRGTGRVALGVLVCGDRVVRAARLPVRGQRRQGCRRQRGLRRRDLHQRPGPVGGEAGAPDRDRGAAVLRRRGTDQRLAHLVRVLARPGDPRLGRSSAASTATGCRSTR